MLLTPENALRIPSVTIPQLSRLLRSARLATSGLGRKEGTKHAAGFSCTVGGFVPPFLESLCYFCQQLIPLEQWQPWLC